ncbi:MAG: metallophosphoesterase family protein [Rhodoferax sp.]
MIERIVCTLFLAGVLGACGGGSSASGSTAVTPDPVPGPTPVAPGPFHGNIVLGAPTTNSIKVKVFSADQSGLVWLAYGVTRGVYTMRLPTTSLVAGKALDLLMDGLSANSQYFYQLSFQPAGVGTASASAEYSFRTARPSGSSFTFTLQADSHLDENSDLDQYRRTLANVLADAPDFHIDLGDTFMTEKHSAPLTALVLMAPDAATVNARYAYEQTNFGLVSHSVPLFLVNGNHDAELGWLNDGTAQNNAVWATQARQQYFLNPVPGAFYGGDSLAEFFVGQRASWYSWQWGDALFVVLDPYWKSLTQASKDGWNLTLGDRQYQWLASTLAASTASYKFIFVHNLVGGLDGQMRGGVEAAPYFEWGGKNQDGTNGFAQKRPIWPLPIHQLLVQNHVTAVFHGHDHLYAKQDLDGIVYQEVPQPSAVNTSSGANLANSYHYATGTILSSSGHLRVTVTPSGITGRYVRAWLPKDETATRKNGQIDDSWSVAAPKK